MSAKQTIDKPDKNVDELAEKLTESATIGDDDDAAAKKREKKMRQKAKKDAEKPNDKNGQVSAQIE